MSNLKNQMGKKPVFKPQSYPKEITESVGKIFKAYPELFGTRKEKYLPYNRMYNFLCQDEIARNKILLSLDKNPKYKYVGREIIPDTFIARPIVPANAYAYTFDNGKDDKITLLAYFDTNHKLHAFKGSKNRLRRHSDELYNRNNLYVYDETAKRIIYTLARCSSYIDGIDIRKALFSDAETLDDKTKDIVSAVNAFVKRFGNEEIELLTGDTLTIKDFLAEELGGTVEMVKTKRGEFPKIVGATDYFKANFVRNMLAYTVDKELDRNYFVMDENGNYNLTEYRNALYALPKLKRGDKIYSRNIYSTLRAFGLQNKAINYIIHSNETKSIAKDLMNVIVNEKSYGKRETLQLSACESLETELKKLGSSPVFLSEYQIEDTYNALDAAFLSSQNRARIEQSLADFFVNRPIKNPKTQNEAVKGIVKIIRSNTPDKPSVIDLYIHYLSVGELEKASNAIKNIKKVDDKKIIADSVKKVARELNNKSKSSDIKKSTNTKFAIDDPTVFVHIMNSCLGEGNWKITERNGETALCVKRNDSKMIYTKESSVPNLDIVFRCANAINSLGEKLFVLLGKLDNSDVPAFDKMVQSIKEKNNGELTEKERALKNLLPWFSLTDGGYMVHQYDFSDYESDKHKFKNILEGEFIEGVEVEDAVSKITLDDIIKKYNGLSEEKAQKIIAEYDLNKSR